MKTQESQIIWDNFQPKFICTYDLYNYAPFFERILQRVFEVCIEENLYIVELRHIFGFVIDDQRKAIEVKGELEIFDRVLKKIQITHPYFRCKIISCGLKKVHGHVQTQIEFMEEALKMEEYKHLIAAYDMVNEEDTTEPIENFALQIMKARERNGGDFPCIFHAGESDFSSNLNMFDALLLGSKRIGHGFNIALHPKLVEHVI